MRFIAKDIVGPTHWHRLCDLMCAGMTDADFAALGRLYGASEWQLIEFRMVRGGEA